MRKLYAVFRIYLRECFAYPAASVIWVIVDIQVALILPAVWLASAGNGPVAGGLSRSDLVAYYLVTMTLSQFIICHLLWDLGFDMREGFFSPQLLRPFPYFTTCTGRNIAWRIAKLTIFLPILPIVTFAYGGLPGVRLHFEWPFWVATVLAHMLSFLAAYCVAMIALWTTEYMSLFRLYYIPEMLLSGRFIPLSAMPPWVREFSEYTHFPYMISFPTKIALGQTHDPEIMRGFGMQIGWCGMFGILAMVLFRRGVRQYVGAGM